MKLKFNIHYNTEWGQQMHVVVNYLTSDRHEREQDFLMQTQDGAEWMLDVVLMESRQRSILSFHYVYQVEDSDGHILRREWNQVKRTYAADSMKTFVFADLWRDRPLNYPLYTYFNKRYEPGIIPLSLPLFRKTIIFRVSAPQLQEGETLALIGNHPAIGNWNPTRYLPLQHIGEFEWILSVNVDGMTFPLEYKYVVIDDNKRQLKTWEEGDNRTNGNHTVSDGEVLVLYGDSLRLKESPMKAAGVVVPVFSLRSEHSCGVGDFGDLKRMADWASLTGLRIIQLLPVNDTTSTHSWTDSHPYNIISAFALHPHYLDLEQLPPLHDEQMTGRFKRQRRHALIDNWGCGYGDGIEHTGVEFLFADTALVAIHTIGNRHLDGLRRGYGVHSHPYRLIGSSATDEVAVTAVVDHQLRQVLGDVAGAVADGELSECQLVLQCDGGQYGRGATVGDCARTLAVIELAGQRRQRAILLGLEQRVAIPVVFHRDGIDVSHLGIVWIWII